MSVQGPPPRASIPMSLIIALSGFGLLVTIVFAAMVIRGIARRPAYITSAVTAEAHRSPLVARGLPTSEAAKSGETALNASNADQVIASGNETAFIKTFALDGDGVFSLRNTNGSITVAAWDQPTVEVKAIQSGLDTGAKVLVTSNPRRLSIRTEQTSNPEVRFEVKLPAQLGRIDLNSVNGSINLSNVGGAITIQSVNGAIELTMKPGFDANLEASTVRGSISIADQFGVAVQNEVAGQRASGQIGSGGQLLKLKTVNGSIKLTNGDTQQIGSGGPRIKLTTVSGSIKLSNRNTQRSLEAQDKLKK